MVLLVILGFIGVLGLALYARALVRHYTQPTPALLPAARDGELERTALWMRWAQFYETVRQGHPAAPFTISGDEINLLILGNQELRDRIRIEIPNGLFMDISASPWARKGRVRFVAVT